MRFKAASLGIVMDYPTVNILYPKAIHVIRPNRSVQFTSIGANKKTPEQSGVSGTAATYQSRIRDRPQMGKKALLCDTQFRQVANEYIHIDKYAYLGKLAILPQLQFTA